MDEANSHTGVLQSWLQQLQVTEGAEFDKVRRAVINHASQRLEGLARRMLRGFPRLRRWEQTGDILQNALLRLHSSLSTIRPETTRQFYGLAATQIRRELIDLTRHHFGPEGDGARHHTDDVQSLIERGPTVEQHADPNHEPTSLAEWSDFHSAVQKLPDAEREVFDLYWYEGLEQQQIAALLNVSDRTIKSRWRSAKLLLRQILSSDDDRRGTT